MCRDPQRKKIRLIVGLLAVVTSLVFGAAGAHTHFLPEAGTDGARWETGTPHVAADGPCWSCSLAKSPSFAPILCIGNVPVPSVETPHGFDSRPAQAFLPRASGSRGPPSLS